VSNKPNLFLLLSAKNIKEKDGAKDKGIDQTEGGITSGVARSLILKELGIPWSLFKQLNSGSGTRKGLDQSITEDAVVTSCRDR
jgi:hypothetical protein